MGWLAQEKLHINDVAKMDASPEALQFYIFADSLNKYEVIMMMKVGGNKYWQYKYLKNILNGKYSGSYK